MLCTELEVFIALCDEVGTLFSYRAALEAKRGNWEYLSSLEVDPRLYTCPETYLGDAQIAAFFRKHPGLPLGVDTKAAAVANFWEAERMCFGTNRRLDPLLSDIEHHGSHVSALVLVWRKKIAEALGKAPSIDRLTELLKFGPGSTYRNTGSFVPLAHKLMDGYTRTSTLQPFLSFWEGTAWGYHASGQRQVVEAELGFGPERADGNVPDGGKYAPREFECVRGNRFTTVAKDAKKDRGICVEPSLNVAYQLAIGTEMSRRMKRSYLQWDKRRAADEHKVLARIGSLTGATATIDLKMASDTVCSSLVELLLPPSWFALVAQTRSTHTLIEGKWVRLEKFSSMGNGFTFELETLIFFTLAKALEDMCGIREDRMTPGLTISVFGDDIIVPMSLSSQMLSCLAFFGFVPNRSKTFTSGRFRESCGGDYFNGHDVRPHYQKEELNEPRQLISLANGLRRFGLRAGHLGNARLHRRAWFKCLDAIPSHIRSIRGPEELGDLAITDDQWIRYNRMRVRGGIRWLQVWRPVMHGATPWMHFRPGVQHAVAVWDCREADPSDRDFVEATLVANYHPVALRALALELGRLPNALPQGVPTRVNGSYIRGYKVGRVAWS